MSSERQVYSGGSYGEEVKADTSRAGIIDDGSIAWPERIVQARRQWPQANPEDFERVGKRTWRDRASGIEYREENGAPLLAVGTDAVRFISAFFVLGGKLVFLSRSDIDPASYVHHGQVIAKELPTQAAVRVIH